MTWARTLPAVAVLAVLPSFANAQQVRRRCAIAHFETSGTSMELARPVALENLTAGLSAAGFDVMPSQESMRREEEAGLALCDSEICLQQIGHLLNVPYVVHGKFVENGNTSFYTLIEVIDASDGRLVARGDDSCVACTRKEAIEAVSNVAAALRDQLARRKVFEAPSPVLPAATAVPPTSAPSVATVQRSHETSRPLRAGAVAAWTIGAASLAAGITLLAINGNHGAFFNSSNELRLHQYDTLGGGAALTVVGGVLAITGGLLWHFDKVRHARGNHVTVAPHALTESPVAIGW